MLSVAGQRGIDLHRPGVDTATEVVEPAEAAVAEVFGGTLAPDAVVTLKNQRRVVIEQEERVVIHLVQQAGTVDRRDGALLGRPHVDKFERRPGLEHRLQLGRRNLVNRDVVRCVWHERQYRTRAPA